MDIEEIDYFKEVRNKFGDTYISRTLLLQLANIRKGIAFTVNELRVYKVAPRRNSHSVDRPRREARSL